MTKIPLIAILLVLSTPLYSFKDLIFAQNYLHKDAPLFTKKYDQASSFLHGLNLGSSYFQINDLHIQYFEKKNIIETPAFILNRYQIDHDKEAHLPVGLSTHKMCTYDQDSLSKAFPEIRRPDAETMILMNTFAKKYNRFKILRNSMWNKMFSCLAHIESLGPPSMPAAYNVANWDLSHKIAKDSLGKDYQKPIDVKFHIDHGQSLESKLNIGLYQFSPTPTGNIKSCIAQWNKLYTDYQIPDDRPERFYTELLADPLQRFNTFCGVLKVAESFSIQINTNSRNNIFNKNNGKEKNERCVSLHLDKSTSYNHFGPLQNSVPNIKSLGISNLNLLLKCSLNGI